MSDVWYWNVSLTIFYNTRKNFILRTTYLYYYIYDTTNSCARAHGSNIQSLAVWHEIVHTKIPALIFSLDINFHKKKKNVHLLLCISIINYRFHALFRDMHRKSQRRTRIHIDIIIPIYYTTILVGLVKNIFILNSKIWQKKNYIRLLAEYIYIYIIIYWQTRQLKWTNFRYLILYDREIITRSMTKL